MFRNLELNSSGCKFSFKKKKILSNFLFLKKRKEKKSKTSSSLEEENNKIANVNRLAVTRPDKAILLSSLGSSWGALLFYSAQ